MMLFAGNFVVGWVVSFLGSLPPGVLNLTIVRVSLRQGLRAALKFALACTLIEFLYGYIAVWLTEQISQYAFFKYLTDGFTLLLLLILGLYYLRKQSRQPSPTDQPVTSAFGLGLGLSVVNVAAFPFWLFYTVLLTQKGWVSLTGSPSVLVYVLGIALGTLTGLWFFVGLSQRLNAVLAAHLHRFDRAMGWLFLGLALVQGLVLASNR
ncbi:LysE family transporter [Larkinella sp. C7]|jgi:threonine/homoserine/homoserine lactone efflux protein|uniref:LysE family transporter n=1 Tax=Larkinella sp. C7 TaxID=2576607 RepID=UPI001110FF8E|nr:LysE family transporter [Larkinella sp. C7]